ncbi:MAG: dTMP kinase [Chromatiales bacterium]|nr:dTMP kinase [Chromatiales bacterium]
MSQTPGKFITVEGGEGAGKSSNIAFIRKYLEEQGIDVIYTREPGGTPLGEEIRDLLLGHKHDGMSDETELLLMFAARAQHLHQVILPALRQGQWVLCDRFTDASFAYQGGGRGVAWEKIENLQTWLQGDLRPDLTLLLDLSVEVGMDRASKRSTPDRFESEALSFFEKVRDAYLRIAKEQPERVKIVDAGQSLETVQHQIKSILQHYLTNTN